MSAKKLIHVVFILGIIVAATAFAQSQGDPYHGPVLSLDVPQGWNVIADGADATGILGAPTPPHAATDGLILSDDSSISLSGPSAKQFDFDSFKGKHDWVYVAALRIGGREGMAERMDRAIKRSVERSRKMPGRVTKDFHIGDLKGTYLSFALEGRTVYEAYGYAVDKGSGNLDVLQIHASADTKAAPNIAEKLTKMLGTISYTNQ